jgi:histone acetyltransferase 1
MIFPRHQNAGHGAELTECVLRDVNQNPDMIDVTAESPSPDFVRLRDYVTTKMCATLPVFRNKEVVRKGFNSEMVTEAQKHFKIPKLQSRRCYEILRMAYTNEHNPEEWTGCFFVIFVLSYPLSIVYSYLTLTLIFIIYPLIIP